ncbi:hypothetical protein BDZ91DRAFT_739394 [Kalaharituber pfeilii]|nr:hypothetical protein BDZ91DRAFT_739394 [Kalaharituber pfeilii]
MERRKGLGFWVRGAEGGGCTCGGRWRGRVRRDWVLEDGGDRSEGDGAGGRGAGGGRVEVQVEVGVEVGGWGCGGGGTVVIGVGRGNDGRRGHCACGPMTTIVFLRWREVQKCPCGGFEKSGDLCECECEVRGSVNVSPRVREGERVRVGGEGDGSSRGLVSAQSCALDLARSETLYRTCFAPAFILIRARARARARDRARAPVHLLALPPARAVRACLCEGNLAALCRRGGRINLPPALGGWRRAGRPDIACWHGLLLRREGCLLRAVGARAL